MFHNILSLVMYICISRVVSYQKSLVWTGGPLHVESEYSCDLWTSSGQYVRENIIAIKAVSYNDKIYVITPRMKCGVLATVWQIVQDKRGIELAPFPNVKSHTLADCGAIQNAVDFYLDHLGHLWILDSGIVETNEQPRCMCPPKVVSISIILGKLTKSIELSSVTKSTTQVQNIVVEYDIAGKPYIYVSDASRGAILVYDTMADSGWVVLACAPATGLQIALIKHTLGHSVLFIVRLQYQGIIELDTSVLKRKKSVSTLTVLGEHTKAISILGFGIHHIYFRHLECSDVLSWDTRKPYEDSHLKSIYSSGPHLTPTSVAVNPLKHSLIVLESNYGDAFLGNIPTYHRINFISNL